MDLLESKRFSSERLRILSAEAAMAAMEVLTPTAEDLEWSPRPLLSLWQQSEVMEAAAMLLLIKDLLLPERLVPEVAFPDFFDMVAAAATAALLLEIKAWKAEERSSRLIRRAPEAE